MAKGADSAGLKVARLIAVVALVVVAFVVGRATCADVSEWAPPEPVDYATLNKDELSWVREGIMERISELEDELAYVQRLMVAKSAWG